MSGGEKLRYEDKVLTEPGWYFIKSPEGFKPDYYDESWYQEGVCVGYFSAEDLARLAQSETFYRRGDLFAGPVEPPEA